MRLRLDIRSNTSRLGIYTTDDESPERSSCRRTKFSWNVISFVFSKPQMTGEFQA